MTTEDEKLAQPRAEAQSRVALARLHILESQRVLIAAQRELIIAQNDLLNMPLCVVKDI